MSSADDDDGDEDDDDGDDDVDEDAGDSDSSTSGHDPKESPAETQRRLALGKRNGYRGPLPPTPQQLDFDNMELDDEELRCPDGMDEDAFAGLSRMEQRTAITWVSILAAG